VRGRLAWHCYCFLEGLDLARYIVRRAILFPPTLLGISILTFALLRLIPGDPAQIMLGEHATADQVARFRMQRGLDRPILIQYLHYVRGLCRGDWGRSIRTNMTVGAELSQRLPATVELSIGAMAVACGLGIPVGIWAAYRHGSFVDLLASGGTLVGVSMPLFWLGLLLGRFFGYNLGWLPPSGRLSIGVSVEPVCEAYSLGQICQGPLGDKLVGGTDLLANFYVLASLITADPVALCDSLRHLVLPSLTLSTVPLAAIVRMTRTCVLGALSEDYVRTARAKGLPERTVLFAHVMRNAGLPILTVAGLQIGSLLSGAMLTETIFSWPGVGQLVVDRVLARDYPIVQGVVLVSALLFVSINLAIDLCYVCLDPRIRYE
jgi:peptide/nickel transport system permease protein